MDDSRRASALTGFKSFVAANGSFDQHVVVIGGLGSRRLCASARVRLAIA